MTFARRPGPVGRFNRRGLASGGGWRPTQLSGCVLWLRADMGVTASGGLVSAWADQSGQAADVVQAVGALQPALVTPSDFGGHQALRFDGTDDVMASANQDWSGVTGCTVFVVYKSTQAANVFGHLLRKGEVAVSRGFELEQRNNLIAGAVLDNATTNFYGTPAASFPTPYAAPHIASMTVDPSQAAASELAIWINGTAQTMSAILSANTASIAGNTAYTVGGSRAGGYHKGDIAEVIVYSRLLADAERMSAQGYLGARYGITVA